MNRIYIKESLEINENISLEQEDAHYLVNVLRAKEKDQIRLFNENGEFLAELNSTSKKKYNLKLIKKLRDYSNPAKLTLAFALIKPDRMLFAIEKAVELGVTDFQPIITKRCQIREINQARIIKCIKEATEQSERLDFASLHETLKLEDFLALYKENIIFFANEKEKSKSLLQLKQENKLYFENSIILIGPEGGFDEEEHSLLREKENIKSISLSSHILRAETAAICAISQIKCLTFCD